MICLRSRAFTGSHRNEGMSRVAEQQVRANLLRWFEANHRRLPWREHYRPYEVWISEIMLQQTQVKTMLPYYDRWMARFPHVAVLARSSEEELLKYWEGLGYYARVRNIHKTAKVLVQEFDSVFPMNYDSLRGMPGIGRYTAGAIMSIAFNADYPVVDGNVARVLARLFDLRTPLRARETQKHLWELAGLLLPKGRARNFNQALMDLGALICTPTQPACSPCPLQQQCLGLARGVVSQRPVKTRAKATTALQVAVGVLLRAGRVFIQKRPPEGLMPHLWEFPGGKLHPGESPEVALVREFEEELEVGIRILQKVAMIQHHYTTFRVTLHAFACRLEDAGRQPLLRAAVDGRWVTLTELDHYAFPAANHKLIQLLRVQQTSLWDQNTVPHPVLSPP